MAPKTASRKVSAKKSTGTPRNQTPWMLKVRAIYNDLKKRGVEPKIVNGKKQNLWSRALIEASKSK